MISRSLERVADHATNIAEDVIFWIQGDDVRHPKSVAAGAKAAPVGAVSTDAAPSGAVSSEAP
jgi:phosphate transport system protein